MNAVKNEKIKSFNIKNLVTNLHECGKLKGIILSTFRADIEYIYDVFPIYDVPVCLLYDRLENKRIIKKRKLHDNMQLCKVPSPKGAYHSKFMLIFTNDNKVYFIVSTANLVPQVTIDASWIQVFDKKTDTPAASCNFEVKLSDYLQKASDCAVSKSGLMVLRSFCISYWI